MLGVVGGSAWAVDRFVYASSIERTARAGYNSLVVALDFKLNFREGLPAEKLDALHERVAKVGLTRRSGAIRAGSCPRDPSQTL